MGRVPGLTLVMTLVAGATMASCSGGSDAGLESTVGTGAADAGGAASNAAAGAEAGAGSSSEGGVGPAGSLGGAGNGGEATAGSGGGGNASVGGGGNASVGGGGGGGDGAAAGSGGAAAGTGGAPVGGGAGDGNTPNAGAASSSENRTWHGAEVFEPGGRPAVGMDAAGNAIVVWGSSASRYDRASDAWSAPEPFSAVIGADLQLSVGDGGDAVAVWRIFASSQYDVWVNRYDADSGSWGEAQRIDGDDVNDAEAPQVAVDPDGNAFVVWPESDGTRTNVQFSYFDASGGSWSEPELLETDDTGDVRGVGLAVDTSGNFVAIWSQLDGESAGIWANRYDANAGAWGGAVDVVNSEMIFGDDPHVGLDDAGNGVAVWSELTGTPTEVHASRYDALSDTWGEPELVQSGSGGGNSPRVAVAGNGNATAVWEESYPEQTYVAANTYDIGTDSWGTAETIESAGWRVDAPQVAIDAVGNSAATWMLVDSGLGQHIYASTYDVGTRTWTGPVALEESDEFAWQPKIVMDGEGNALAVWPNDYYTEAGQFIQHVFMNWYR